MFNILQVCDLIKLMLRSINKFFSPGLSKLYPSLQTLVIFHRVGGEIGHFVVYIFKLINN